MSHSYTHASASGHKANSFDSIKEHIKDTLVVILVHE